MSAKGISLCGGTLHTHTHTHTHTHAHTRGITQPFVPAVRVCRSHACLVSSWHTAGTDGDFIHASQANSSLMDLVLNGLLQPRNTYVT